jgi:hypothetical protein
VVQTVSIGAEHARCCEAGEIDALLRGGSEEILRALLENPALSETHLCLLLERTDLSAALVEHIATNIVANREWQRSRRLRCAVVAYPHVARRVALKAARELHVADLLAISLRPSAPAEVRRFAEELLLARVPQLPLGQKLVVARRGSGRVAGALLAEGHSRIAGAVLDNPRLAEAQVLRALGDAELPELVLAAIASHAKWSGIPNVRMALASHRHAPLEHVRRLLPGLSPRELDRLGLSSSLRDEVRDALHHELARRAT